MDRDPAPVSVITTAGLSGSEDRALRQRRYVITQGIRVASFVLAVTLPIPLWAKMVLITASFVLPWMGVMAANAGPTLQPAKGRNSVVERVEATPFVLDPKRTIDQDD
jgi:hypothetical protein